MYVPALLSLYAGVTSPFPFATGMKCGTLVASIVRRVSPSGFLQTLLNILSAYLQCASGTNSTAYAIPLTKR